MAKPSEEESIYHNNILTLNVPTLPLTDSSLKSKFMTRMINNKIKEINTLKKEASECNQLEYK